MLLRFANQNYGMPFTNPSPINFVQGGSVLKSHQNLRKTKQTGNDVVYARLMPGEIVIPVKHTKKVKEYLRKEHIKLPTRLA